MTDPEPFSRGDSIVRVPASVFLLLSVCGLVGVTLALYGSIGQRHWVSASASVGFVALSVLTAGLLYVDVTAVGEGTSWSPSVALWTGAGVVAQPVAAALYLRRRATVIFEVRADLFDERVSAVETSADAFLQYRDYLTRSRHRELASRVDGLLADYDRFREEAPSGLLRTSPTEQLYHYGLRVNTIDTTVDDREVYNRLFVERELDRYGRFFDGIGGPDTSLSREQRRAVVRNETHNRVIAGAGTGKTLVLTARVAYLVEKRGVPPEEILVVAFTGEAADEMSDRLATEFGLPGIDVRTIHSFGYQVIADTQQSRPAVFGPDDLEHFVTDAIDDRAEGMPPEFYQHLRRFLLYHDLPAVREEDFETKEGYVEFLAGRQYETLRGETVRSRAEKLIADFLHVNRIDYQYERLADWADTADGRGEYRPDFYLPEIGVYIEHFGIDASGEVAPWLSQSTREYVADVEWKRDQFAEAEYGLVETYQFEFDAGLLRKALSHRLSTNGVGLDPMEYGQLIEETYERHERQQQVHGLFQRFVENARVFDTDIDDVRARLTESDPRQYHFGRAGCLLLQRYVRRLVELDMIDFADMIFEATDRVRSEQSRYAETFTHVLVDEFQDVSIGQAELVGSLTGPDSDDARLFAVGDDWQSIYSFQGAVVDLFVDFEERFSPAATTSLTTNYRSPRNVVEASTRLIEANDLQLQKETKPGSSGDGQITEHRIRGYTERDYVENTSSYIVGLIEEYLSTGSQPGEIMVVCRYDDAAPFLDAIRRGLQAERIPYRGSGRAYQPDEDVDPVEVYSIHQAKGREARHVIVAHASEGSYGFPASNRESKLLAPVQGVDTNTIAEERRLFYVALTRTTETVDLTVEDGSVSRFVREITEFVDDVPTNDRLVSVEETTKPTTIVARVADLWSDTHAKIHQQGVLEDRTASIRFVSWGTHDPPTLDPDSWYRFEDVQIDSYEGDLQVVLRPYSEVTEVSGTSGQTGSLSTRDRS